MSSSLRKRRDEAPELLIRQLVDRLVVDVTELLRAEVMRGLGLPEATATERPLRRAPRAPREAPPSALEAPEPPGLIDAPELGPEARVIALARDNPDAPINSGTVAEVLGVPADEARALIAKLVKAGKLAIVGDRNGLPRIVAR